MTQNSKKAARTATTSSSSEPVRVQRKTLVYHIPTKAYLARCNPVGKRAILEWYERESRVLEARKTRAVRRTFSAYTQEVDAETRQPVGRPKGPYDSEIEHPKLSEQDYLVTKRCLEQRFKDLKAEHNRRIRAAKSAEEQSP